MAASGAAVRSWADLPGPPGWPLLGNATQIKSETLHTQLEQWAEYFGPMFRIKLGPQKALVVSDPIWVQRVLRERPAGFRRSSHLAQVLAELGASGVFTAEGDHWLRQRKLTMAAFGPDHVQRYFTTLRNCAERLCARWHGLAGQWLDLNDEFSRYTIDVTCALAFGTASHAIEDPQGGIQPALRSIFAAVAKRMVAPFPYWRYIKLPADRKLDAQLAKVNEYCRQMLHLARQRIDQDPNLAAQPRNFIEALVAQQNLEPSLATEAEMTGNVLTLLLAGEDTSANTLTWAVWLLHKHPQHWQALQDASYAALHGEHFPSSKQQLDDWPLLGASLHETMRVKSVAPLLFLQNNGPCVLADVSLEADTLIILLTRQAGMQNPAIPDAWAFDPQRWLNEQQGAAVKQASLPFGAGPRFCPGRYLAIAEMGMMLASLLRNFKLEIAPEQRHQMPEVFNFTMQPQGLRARLMPRDGAPRTAMQASPEGLSAYH